MTGFPRFLPTAIRDALPVAAVALLVFQGIRLWGAERYVVPSASMEPCLHGDPRTGDVVLVEKWSAFRAPRPAAFDLVVVRSPDDPHRHIVKRVVADGDDAGSAWLRLDDGDLWLGPDPDHLRRLQKDPGRDRDLRVPWFDLGVLEPAEFLVLGEATLEARTLLLSPVSGGIDRALEALTPAARRQRLDELPPRPLPAGWCGLRRPVDTGWLAAGEHHGGEAGQAVADFGVTLTVVPGPGCAGLVLALEQRPDLHAFHWLADGRVEVVHNGVVAAVAAARAPVLRPGAAIELEYGHLDGRLFLRADGLTVDLRERPPAGAEAGPAARGAPPSGLCFCAIGGPARVTGLQVFRDLHWFQPRMPFRASRDVEVPAGHLYLLGDNSMDSHDSRYFGPVPKHLYVGTPAAVLAPAARRRWLGR